MPQIINLADGSINHYDSTKVNDSYSDVSVSNDFVVPSFVDTAKLIKEKYPGKILFTIQEISSELNLSYETIRKFITSGKIQAIFFGQRKMVHINELTNIIINGVK